MTDWIQPTMLLYACFCCPGGVISQDYEPCVLYLYFPLFPLLFISSNYAFHSINLSLSIYLYLSHCFVRRLVCSLAVKHLTSRSFLIYFSACGTCMISCALRNGNEIIICALLKLTQHENLMICVFDLAQAGMPFVTMPSLINPGLRPVIRKNWLVRNNTGLNVLPRDVSKCGWKEVGIELPNRDVTAVD